MNKKPDLYIICAGMGSRMGGTIPKALVKITDKPNLTTTLQQIGHKFDKVFVVTNEENQGPWLEYFVALSKDYPELWNNVFNVAIKSGRGDGHAVLEGLRKSQALWQVSPDIVIAWGDVFFPHAEIIDEMLIDVTPSEDQNYRFGDFVGLIPLVNKESPYVAINTAGPIVTGAFFSKLGEQQLGIHGHDQSVFRFKREFLYVALTRLDAALCRNGTYMAPNGELSLLYIFHYAANTQSGAIYHFATKYPTLSFNTLEEVAQIQQEIHNKWTTTNRS